MKNKILIISLLIIILISFATVSFCSYDMTINEHTYKFPDEFGRHTYKVFLYDNSVGHLSYLLLSSDSPFSVVQNIDGNYILFSESSFYQYSLSQGSQGSVFEDIYDFSSCEMSLVDKYNSYYKGYIATYTAGENSFYYTTHDIKDTEGTVVFHRAPVEYLEPMKTQEVTEIPQMIIKLVMAILPAILMIVGVFLVIYLMRYKIFSHL